MSELKINPNLDNINQSEADLYVEKLQSNVLTILDMLRLRDSNHIYHFTWFGQLSLFLMLSHINDTPITMFTFPSDVEIQDRGIFNDNKIK